MSSCLDLLSHNLTIFSSLSNQTLSHPRQPFSLEFTLLFLSLYLLLPSPSPGLSCALSPPSPLCCVLFSPSLLSPALVKIPHPIIQVLQSLSSSSLKFASGNSIVYRNSKLWKIIIWLLCIINCFCLWHSIIWWYRIIFVWKKLWLSIIWFYDDFPSYYDFPSYDDYAS